MSISFSPINYTNKEEKIPEASPAMTLVIILAITIPLLYFGYRNVQKYRVLSKNVMGKIVSVSCSSGFVGSGSSRNYKRVCALNYKFTVKDNDNVDKEYQSTLEIPNYNGNTTPNTDIKVYFNPANPAENNISNSTRNGYMMMLLGAFLLGMGVYGVFFYKNKK